MKFFYSKLRTKYGPILLAGLTAAVLVLTLLLSSTYSESVLAQTKPATTTIKNPAPATATTTTTKGQTIDDSGQSGFVICGNTVNDPCNISHLFRAFIIIINYLITMAGLVAILFIVIAGVQMTMSRGEEGLRAAKGRMAGAVFGLVLVAIAFVLINSLLAGSLSLGIKEGGLILSNPKAYIQNTK